MKRIFIAIGLTAMAVLGSGCASSSHSASFPASSTTSVEKSVAPRRGGARHTTTSLAAAAGAAKADLVALKRELGGVGGSLDGASSALAESDPNQTRSQEGGVP